MSGLVLNESLIDRNDVQKKTIVIDRITSINLGVRVWFVIKDVTGKRYQRWSMLMNQTDEILLLAQSGDKLTIEYIEDDVEDTIAQQFEHFHRTIILKVIE